MSTLDIFNFDEKIHPFINDSNKVHINKILKEFKEGRFTITLSLTRSFKENHQVSEGLATVLILIDATCHAQIGEGRQAKDILTKLYQSSQMHTINDLILYGNLAFMCDYKLSRRIMSDAVKQIELAESINPSVAAQAYLILGEAEENLQKIVRAIKYYKQALAYVDKEEEERRHSILFLHFKLGALYSQNNEMDEAIEYLKKTVEYINDDPAYEELEINSLVCLAKIYGQKDNFTEAFTYLTEVIPLIEHSPLQNKRIHADALTDMAYNYFTQSNFDHAVPYYDRAITIQQKLEHPSSRDLGIIHMQYAYCLEHQTTINKTEAEATYERAYDYLKQTNDIELLSHALQDIVEFFERTNNKKKKSFYENKLLIVAKEASKANEQQMI